MSDFVVPPCLVITDDDIQKCLEKYDIVEVSDQNQLAFVHQKILEDRNVSVNDIRRALEVIRPLDFIKSNRIAALYMPWGEKSETLERSLQFSSRQENITTRLSFLNSTRCYPYQDDAMGVNEHGTIMKAIHEDDLMFTIGCFYSHGLPELYFVYGEGLRQYINAITNVANGWTKRMLASRKTWDSDRDDIMSEMYSVLCKLFRIDVENCRVMTDDDRKNYAMGYALTFYINFMDTDAKNVPFVFFDLRQSNINDWDTELLATLVGF